jgi:hypothetical protein
MCEKNQPHRDRTKRFVQHDAALRRRRDQNEFDGQGGDAFRRGWRRFSHGLGPSATARVAAAMPFGYRSPNAIRPEHTLTAFLSAVLVGASRFAHAPPLCSSIAVFGLKTKKELTVAPK